MKNKSILVLIIVVLLNSLSASAQTDEPFKLTGEAKFITTWTEKTPNEVIGKLSSGDKISIQYRQVNVYVTLIHNTISKNLLTPEDFSSDNPIIKVYEYDFDNDDQKEIIIIFSFNEVDTKVVVFRSSGGLAEKVGNFNAQFEIILDKNKITMPIGSQGLKEEYFFIDGSFYELTYHDPNKKEK